MKDPRGRNQLGRYTAARQAVCSAFPGTHLLSEITSPREREGVGEERGGGGAKNRRIPSTSGFFC